MTSRFAAIYIVLITTAWVVLFYKYLFLRDKLNKNKMKYDLRNMSVKIEPGDDYAKLVFWIGKPVKAYLIQNSEFELRGSIVVILEHLIKWLEEEPDASSIDIGKH